MALAPVQLPAQSAAQKELERLERERAQRETKATQLEASANEAAREIASLRQRLVRAAAARDALERDVERSEVRLIRLRRQESEMVSLLTSDREAMENIVIALIGVERNRPPALAVRPDDATEAARAAILMGLIAPHLEERTEAVGAQLARLKALRQDILMQNDRFAAATRQLAEARQTVGALISQRRDLELRLRRDAGVERERLVDIARRASDLRELIERLGAELPRFGRDGDSGPAFARGFPEARGRLIRPALGPVRQDFGDDLDAGGASAGLVIGARAGGQVVAPFDARVEFAGPFRSWGRVLILNVGEGYHIVLAGLGATFVEAGQEVLAGEPVAEMSGDRDSVADLYMEVRKDGSPLDPAPWLVPAASADQGGEAGNRSPG
jgi:murein hydrolase activator